MQHVEEVAALGFELSEITWKGSDKLSRYPVFTNANQRADDNSRRHECHKGPKDGGFFGFWSIEAAGVVKAFAMDDQSLVLTSARLCRTRSKNFLTCVPAMRHNS